MANNNELEAYTLPQGVMIQLARQIAGGKPGLISHVGLGTYIDPRVEGGRLNSCCTEQLAEVMELDGKPDRGILKLLFELVNQNGALCQSGVKTFMMKRAPGIS